MITRTIGVLFHNKDHKFEHFYGDKMYRKQGKNSFNSIVII